MIIQEKDFQHNICTHVLLEVFAQLKAIPTASIYKAFRHVETLFVQGNQVRTESKQTSFFDNKKEDNYC